MYFLHLIKSLKSKSDELHMHFSYQHCLGLMLREDYRALAAVIVEPGRALLNNFNSEKLETCHHCCLDHPRKIFSSSESSQSLSWSLGSGCHWQQRWGDSWEFLVKSKYMVWPLHLQQGGRLYQNGFTTWRGTSFLGEKLQRIHRPKQSLCSQASSRSCAGTLFWWLKCSQ